MQRGLSICPSMAAVPLLRTCYHAPPCCTSVRQSKTNPLRSTHPFSLQQRRRCIVQAGQAVVQEGIPSEAVTAQGMDIFVPPEWEIKQYKFVSEYDSHVYQFRHKKSGAELMSVENSDENKTFGAVFRTPVENSMGIPHILEHSVLCGSRKFPVKDPFQILARSSVNTFLNAFTYPDRTCYPVASTNLKDFYNLVDVYVDAVLHPRCKEDPNVMKQEGWHYELDTENKLIYKGVVYNEMKGVYSQPDMSYYREVIKYLFPDNCYVHDSGGDPAEIPDLTFEQFKKFHDDYYHPSNARFWFYGDDDRYERLRILDSYLSEFDTRQVDSSIVTQQLFSEPKQFEHTFPASEKDKESPKNFETLNWVLSDKCLDVETDLQLSFLNYLLTGTYASPLMFALNESGLGEAVVGGGIDDTLCQPIFAIGMKGVKDENLGRVEDLILGELKRLSEVGFTSSAIEAATNSIEFYLRENNTGSFPRGLSLMLRAMRPWIYGEDPFQSITWSDALEKVKQDLNSEQGNQILKQLIKQYLLNNTHRVKLTLRPEFQDVASKQEQERLQNAGLNESDLKQVVQQAEDLKKIQETPDSLEDMKKVPSLSLGDIPTKIVPVPTKTVESQNVIIQSHDLFTNNIVYLSMGIDMKGVPAELLPLLPLFCDCLTNMDTEKETFIELTEKIDRKTGGVSVSPLVMSKRGSDQPIALLAVGGKCMGDKVDEMTSIFLDLLFCAKFDNQDRFKQMVLESKQGKEAGIVGSGHRYASMRLGAQYTIAGGVSELTSGYSQYKYIKQLEQRLENGEWEEIRKDLFAIRDSVLSSKKVYVNITADQQTTDSVMGNIESMVEKIQSRDCPVKFSEKDWGSVVLPKKNEALVIPTQVNYVSKAVNLFTDANYNLHGSSYVIDKHIGSSWLYDQVRLIGGAYGGFCSFNNQSGIFGFGSYRDPNVLSTYKAYDESSDFIRKEIDQEELERAIIGTMGDVDQYQLPDAKGYSQFMRYLLGISDEERQNRRDEILGTNSSHFAEFANILDVVKTDKARCTAVVSLNSLEQAQREQPELFDEVIKVL